MALQCSSRKRLVFLRCILQTGHKSTEGTNRASTVTCILMGEARGYLRQHADTRMQCLKLPL